MLGSGSPDAMQVRLALAPFAYVFFSNSSTIGFRTTTRATEASIRPALFSAKHVNDPASSLINICAVKVPVV